jgi:hypothetical protein
MLRHRLQKIFLGDQVRFDDFPKVDGIMSAVESFEVTLDLLKVSLLYVTMISNIIMIDMTFFAKHETA